MFTVVRGRALCASTYVRIWSFLPFFYCFPTPIPSYDNSTSSQTRDKTAITNDLLPWRTITQHQQMNIWNEPLE